MAVQFLKILVCCELHGDLSCPSALVVVDGIPMVPGEALCALVVVLVLLKWDVGVRGDGVHELWEPLVDGTFNVKCCV